MGALFSGILEALRGAWRFVAFVVVPCTLWFATVNNTLKVQASSIEMHERRMEVLESSIDARKEAEKDLQIKILEQLNKLDSRLSRIEGRLKWMGDP